MNIFALDKDPRLAAQYHCDKHVVKMILEYAQIMSTLHRIHDTPNADKLYRPTHVNHPSTIWAGYTRENYIWLYGLFVALCEEYTHRYFKIHKTWSKLGVYLSSPPSQLKALGMTPFARAMPEPLKSRPCMVIEDIVECYREYYKEHKRDILIYTRRETPPWLNIGKENQ